GGAGDMAAMRFSSGVLFDGDTAADMVRAIDRTMALQRHPDIWRAMQRNAMNADFGWGRATPLYLNAYHALRPDLAPVASSDSGTFEPSRHARRQRRAEPLPLTQEASIP